jgi:hypothetical protein
MLYATGIKCSDISVGDLGLACNSTQGFEDSYVPCGTTGRFVTCQAVVLTVLACVAQVSPDPPVQQCQ